MHAIVAPTTVDGTAAVIDLAHPDIGQPQIQNDGRTLTCVVPWSPTDAVTSAYAWLRDGSVLRGAKSFQRALSRFDRGRDLSARNTRRRHPRSLIERPRRDLVSQDLNGDGPITAGVHYRVRRPA